MNQNLMKVSAAAVATMLLSATPALADEHGGARVDSDTDVHVNAGLHLGPIVSALAHQLADLRDNDDHATSTDQDRDNDNDDQDNDHHHAASSATHPFAGEIAAFGTVSGTSGTSFTLNPVHVFGATTSGTATVTTSASTQFRGGATSTASLSSGSDVIVVGTTSTSTPNTITATIVVMLRDMAQFFVHLFSH